MDFFTEILLEYDSMFVKNSPLSNTYLFDFEGAA